MARPAALPSPPPPVVPGRPRLPAQLRAGAGAARRAARGSARPPQPALQGSPGAWCAAEQCPQPHTLMAAMRPSFRGASLTAPWVQQHPPARPSWVLQSARAWARRALASSWSSPGSCCAASASDSGGAEGSGSAEAAPTPPRGTDSASCICNTPGTSRPVGESAAVARGPACIMAHARSLWEGVRPAGPPGVPPTCACAWVRLPRLPADGLAGMLARPNPASPLLAAGLDVPAGPGVPSAAVDVAAPDGCPMAASAASRDAVSSAGQSACSRDPGAERGPSTARRAPAGA